MSQELGGRRTLAPTEWLLVARRVAQQPVKVSSVGKARVDHLAARVGDTLPKGDGSDDSFVDPVFLDQAREIAIVPAQRGDAGTVKFPKACAAKSSKTCSPEDWPLLGTLAAAMAEVSSLAHSPRPCLAKLGIVTPNPDQHLTTPQRRAACGRGKRTKRRQH